MSLTADVRGVWASRELLWNLTLRELRTKYRRSFLGWTWSLLNPLATVAIFSFVFGVLFQQQPPIGDPSGIHQFAFYMLAALLPWQFFLNVTGGSMGAMIGNAGLVRRVAFPRETLVFAQATQAFVQFAIEMLLLTAVVSVFGSPRVLLMVPFTLVLMLLVALFATGIGLILASVSVYFRDTAYLWTIVVQLWFYGTPIVYPPSILEGRVSDGVKTLLGLNPFARFAEGFRRTLYDGRAPGATTTLVLALMSVLTLLAGWSLFKRLSRRFAEEL